MGCHGLRFKRRNRLGMKKNCSRDLQASTTASRLKTSCGSIALLRSSRRKSAQDHCKQAEQEEMLVLKLMDVH